MLARHTSDAGRRAIAVGGDMNEERVVACSPAIIRCSVCTDKFGAAPADHGQCGRLLDRGTGQGKRTLHPCLAVIMAGEQGARA